MLKPRLWRRLTFALLAILLPISPLSGGRGLFAEERARALVKAQKPVYPEIARQMRLEGSIVMAIVILADGHVSEMHVTSGHPMFVPAAKAAVQEWRYAPASSSTETLVSIDFHLH